MEEAAWRPDLEHVARVDISMANWRQGDVVSPGPNGWLADRDHPLTRQTAALGGSGFGFTQAETSQIALVTQTCDIVKPCSTEDPARDAWPFVQVCPVVTLTGPALAEAARGRSARFAPLPALGDDQFADLMICTTLEKSVLVGLGDPVTGCSTDEDREKFAAAVDRNRRRFAFPDGMDVALQPLRTRFRDKWEKDSPEGRRIAEVWEIRVRRADHTPWDGDSTSPVEVSLTFVVAPEALPKFEEEEAEQEVTQTIKEWCEAHPQIHELAAKLESTGNPVDLSYIWQRLVEEWIQKCAAHPHVEIAGASAESAASYSLARARLEPRLDLDYLSNL
jgi:hypothetical protein